MSRQEIYLQAHTSSDGMVHLNLDIPIGVSNQDIELTLSYETSNKQTLLEKDLQDILSEAKSASSLERHIGTIKIKEDPLDFQQRIRDEW